MSPVKPPSGGGPPRQNKPPWVIIDEGAFDEFAEFDAEPAAVFGAVPAGKSAGAVPPEGLDVDDLLEGLPVDVDDLLEGLPVDEADEFVYDPGRGAVRTAVPPRPAAGPFGAPSAVSPALRTEAAGLLKDFREHVGRGMELVDTAGLVVHSIIQDGRVEPALFSVDWSAKASAFLDGAYDRERRARADELARDTILPHEIRDELQRLMNDAGRIEILLGHIYYPVLRAMVTGRAGIDSLAGVFLAAEDADKGRFAYALPEAEKVAGRLRRVHAWIEANAIVTDGSLLAGYRTVIEIIKKMEQTAINRRDFNEAERMDRARADLGTVIVDALHMIVDGETLTEIAELDRAMKEVIAQSSAVNGNLLPALESAERSAVALTKKLVADKSGLISGAEAVFGDLLERSASHDALRRSVDGLRTTAVREHVPNMLKNIMGRPDWKPAWLTLVSKSLLDVIGFLEGAGERFHAAGLQAEKRRPSRPSDVRIGKTADKRVKISRDAVRKVLADTQASMDATLKWLAGQGEAVAMFNWAELIARIEPWFVSASVSENEPLRAVVCALYDAVCALRDGADRIQTRFDGRPSNILLSNPLPHRLAMEIAACLLGAAGRNGHVSEVVRLLMEGESAGATKVAGVGTSASSRWPAGWPRAGSAGRVRTQSVPLPLLAVLYELRTRVQALKNATTLDTSVREIIVRHREVIRGRLNSYAGSALWHALTRVADDLDGLCKGFSQARVAALVSDTAGPLRGSLNIAIELLEKEGGGGSAGGQPMGGHGTGQARNAAAVWNDLAPANLAGAAVFTAPMYPLFVPPMTTMAGQCFHI